MDPITIGLLAGAGLGLLKGNKNVQKEAANDRYRKVAVAMSPWTGMGDPGALNLGGPLESAASGAAMGGQVAGLMGKMGGKPTVGADAAAATQATGPQAYQQMQQDMGAGPYSTIYAGEGYGSPGAMGVPQMPMMPYSQLGKLQYG